MSQVYTYSVSGDMPGGQVSVPRLRADIEASSIVTALETIRRDGDVLVLVFADTLPAGEKTTLDGDTTGPAGGLMAAHIADDTLYLPVYEVATYSQGTTRLDKVEWYETDNGDGTYSGLSRDAVYTWSASKLVSVVETSYYKDGAPIVGETRTAEFYTTSDGKKVTKRTQS